MAENARSVLAMETGRVKTKQISLSIKKNKCDFLVSTSPQQNSQSDDVFGNFG